MRDQAEFDFKYEVENETLCLTQNGETIIELRRKAMLLLFRWLREQVDYLFTEGFENASITLEGRCFKVEFDSPSNMVVLGLGTGKLCGIPRNKLGHFLAWASCRMQGMHFVIEVGDFIGKMLRNKELKRAEKILDEAREIFEKSED